MGTATLLLDTATWDLVLDANGNIAVATEPYSLSQDAASAIKTFLGEVYFDSTIGVAYLAQIFGKRPSVSLLKSLIEQAAKTVPGVAAVRCFISSLEARAVTGQVQVVSKATGQVTASNFATINPQGAG